VIYPRADGWIGGSGLRGRFGPSDRAGMVVGSVVSETKRLGE